MQNFSFTKYLLLYLQVNINLFQFKNKQQNLLNLKQKKNKKKLFKKIILKYLRKIFKISKKKNFILFSKIFEKIKKIIQKMGLFKTCKYINLTETIP